VDRILKTRKLDPTVVYFADSSLRVLSYAVVLIAAVHKLGVETTSLVAMLGAVGLAIGLALRGQLSNVASGLLTIIFRPFVDATGKMDVAYFNPRPINVSKAEATREGSTTKVLIELRDTGYPGSTYTLTYDPQSDQLKGVYFQATLQQNFEVVFFRIR
jgi:small conductance mechanosensitive channel